MAADAVMNIVGRDGLDRRPTIPSVASWELCDRSPIAFALVSPWEGRMHIIHLNSSFLVTICYFTFAVGFRKRSSIISPKLERNITGETIGCSKMFTQEDNSMLTLRKPP
jgi:hypothetical protein